jgi:hypothetical protein
MKTELGKRNLKNRLIEFDHAFPFSDFSFHRFDFILQMSARSRST